MGSVEFPSDFKYLVSSGIAHDILRWPKKQQELCTNRTAIRESEQMADGLSKILSFQPLMLKV